jgi:endonuclease/exonuclease/phosphatase family metal-dependent hydrolase
MKFILIMICFISFSAMSEEIKVLTWNVFMLPKPINFSKQRARTPLIIEKLQKSHYDVIFLQEAFRSKFQKELKENLSETYPYQGNLKKGKNILHVLNSGLYIASKYPFTVVGKKYFDSCIHSDCFASKGVLLVEITLPTGKKVQIANTHMQAWEDEEARRVRTDQLFVIKNLLTSNQKDHTPQILIGDLNIDGLLQDEYEKALDLMEMTSTPLSGELRASNGFKIDCYKTPGDDKKEQWLDHLWFKANKSSAKILDKHVIPMMGALNKKSDCPLSDHHAVEATLSL